jgi:hypothetical protein
MTTLKDCLYRTIHRNQKPLKQIAEEIDMAISYLTRSALPDQDESETGCGVRFPLKKLVPIIRSTGDFCVLDFIEQSLGRVAFKLPAGENTTKEIFHLSLTSVKEFGELMSELDASFMDGRITDKEKIKIRKEGYEAIKAIMTLLRFVETSK